MDLFSSKPAVEPKPEDGTVLADLRKMEPRLAGIVDVVLMHERARRAVRIEQVRPYALLAGYAILLSVFHAGAREWGTAVVWTGIALLGVELGRRAWRTQPSTSRTDGNGR